ncbi:MAG: cold shock domain-containing protein [Symploca sp. SIO3C6]|nr:cold shock domain-containing protein [Symploca sp. SIO3C6]
MKHILYKGQLVAWKDDRGFGFIKPDDGGKEVFLHISTLKGADRRPKVGDTILYELVSGADGKVRASKASIQGFALRSLPRKQKTKTHSLLERVIAIGFIVLLVMEFSRSRFPSPIRLITKPGCTIKGNISWNTGNKLYHLPGMKDYESTVIEQASGEKWFCTESEAIAKGWRKAPR